VQFNAPLNNLTAHVALSDITLELPTGMCTPDARTLYVGNFPHAIAPSGAALPPAIAGGHQGSDITCAALRTLAMQPLNNAAILIFAYSLYSSRSGEVQLLTEAQRLFSSTYRVSWVELPDVTLWRVNGRKQQANPMRLVGGLELKATCRLSVPESVASRVALEYAALAEQLTAQGWDSLAAGLVEIIPS
jgi:hypothetical protein